MLSKKVDMSACSQEAAVGCMKAMWHFTMSLHGTVSMKPMTDQL